MHLSSNTVLDLRRLENEVDYFHEKKDFVYDVETMGGEHRGQPQVNQVVWMSMATHGRTIVIPMGHPNGNRMIERPRRKKNPITKKMDLFPAKWEDPPEQLRPSQVFDTLRPLFMDDTVEKTGSGFLFDVLSTAKYFGEIHPGPYHDTIILHWLLNENLPYGLKDITKAYYKRQYDAEHVGRRIEDHPFWKVNQYAYLDAKYEWLHKKRLLPRIEEEGLAKVYRLEQQIFEVLLDMASEGVLYDEEKAREILPGLEERRAEYEGQFYRSIGKIINLNSPKQKVDILYGPKSEGGLGLKPWKLTKGGLAKKKAAEKQGRKFEPTKYDYSTDAEALEKFADNQAINYLLQFQDVDRVVGTYLHGYLGHEDPDNPKKNKPSIIFDGKVYPDFVQYGTVTGRFSGRTPNLQNIPRPDTDLGKEIRSLFIAGEGHKLIVSDYGQIELVVLAHFVGRGALYDGFFKGIDPHTMTAALVFNQDPQDLQRRVDAGEPEAKGFRQAAKAINFAVVYGAGPDKVASMAGVSVSRAKQILNTHEREFPEVYKFKDQALRVARSRKPPHLSTLAGRKRRLPSLNARDFSTRGKAERQAINSLIQGSAADLIKVAMVRTNEALYEADAGGKLILTVHDELVVRTPDETAEQNAAIVREAMVGAGIQKWVNVPLSIDLKTVDRWSEAK